MAEKNIQQILSHSSNFKEILNKARYLQALNSKVKGFLPSNLQDHCEVMDYQQNCLLLSVPNAAVATTIRYQSAELLMKLRTEGRLPAISAIKCRIQSPEELAEEERKYVRTLSKESAVFLQEAAKNISNQALAKALYALSLRADSVMPAVALAKVSIPKDTAD